MVDLKSAVEQEIQAPWGEQMPRSRMIMLTCRHTTYHIGQLCYLQCVLGDTEDHWG